MADPLLQMFRSDIPTEEIGIVSNPIDFGLCNAGEDTILPYDILLWNDKASVLSSDDAYSIYIELLRLYVSQIYISDGLPNQTYTVSYIPVVNEDSLLEVTIDGVEWTRVVSLIGYDQKEVFTFDFTTGELIFGDNINGKIPPIGLEIKITYTPDLNTFSKTVYSDTWISFKSSGVVSNEIHIGLVTPELGTKIDDDMVEVLHYPYVTDIIGVWDNISKTGTNYYTGGSFDSNTGRISLGTSLTDPDPYIEYKYQIGDDSEAGYTALGIDVTHGPLNRIPQNNAKRIQLKVTVPSTAETEGGAYIKSLIRVIYKV